MSDKPSPAVGAFPHSQISKIVQCPPGIIAMRQIYNPVSLKIVTVILECDFSV